jgi:hypothetical protein
MRVGLLDHRSWSTRIDLANRFSTTSNSGTSDAEIACMLGMPVFFLREGQSMAAPIE